MVRCDVRKLMTVPVLMMLAVPAAAQDVVYRFEQRGVAPGQGDVFTLPVPPPPPPGAGGMMGLLAVEPFEGAEPITGAPYSADISTDVVQSLADGNRIERHTTSSVARDGQGRVRREQQLTAIGGILPQVDGRIISIMDPVAHVHYSLDPARKTAMRSPLPVIKKIEGAARTRVAGVARFEVGIGTGPVTTQTFIMNGASNDARTESLGTSEIEGVQAQGTRTIVTIPAGAIGNQAPIEMLNEQWFSPELGTIVMSRRSDPRFGETTYRLQNIVRAEPATDLFQIPSDYTVEAVPAFGNATFIRKPAAP
jgi:hypothetical protein